MYIGLVDKLQINKKVGVNKTNWQVKLQTWKKVGVNKTNW